MRVRHLTEGARSPQKGGTSCRLGEKRRQGTSCFRPEGRRGMAVSHIDKKKNGGGGGWVRKEEGLGILI